MPRPDFLNPSDSEGDSGTPTDDDEIDEEEEDEDGSCCDPYDDESSYVEEGGSDIQDDGSDSEYSEDGIYDNARPLHGPLANDDSRNFHFDDKNTADVPVFARDDECIEFIKKAAVQKTVPGLSTYMSALEANWKVGKNLAHPVASCIAGSRTRKEAGTRTNVITLEGLLSLLPYRFCAQPPTLKILELYIRRQILIGCVWRRLQTVELLPHHLLDHCKEPDVLEHICFRLRLSDAPNPDCADDEFPSLIRATPSRTVITFLREDSTSPTVLAGTRLQHDSCSTFFFFYHSVSEEKVKTLVSRFTSVPKRVFIGSGICVRSVTASFSKPPRPHKGSSRSLEDALKVSARCACRLALTVVREAELNEIVSNQGRVQYARAAR